MINGPRYGLVIILVIASVFLCAHLGMAASERPHIVLILADDMGYGDIASYNPESKIPTPHLQRLSAEGMRFTDAHAGGSSCIPSRYALMTGRFAVRRSMKLGAGPLIEEDRMTVASLLRDHEYKTFMVGKWHLGFDQNLQRKKVGVDYTKPLRGGPMDCGFDSFFGMHASLDIPPYFYFRGRSPVMPPTEDVAANNSTGDADVWNDIQGAFWRAGKIAPDFKLAEVTPRLFREAEEVIRSHGDTTTSKPMFLYLALPSPHTPWLPTEAFHGKSGAGMYGDFVMQVDAGVGGILEALEATDMMKDTLLLFSSDNGPVWYDKDMARFGHRSSGVLRGMKFDSWEGGHRMPFLVRWPGKVAAGSVCAQTVVFSDVLATLADIVGLKNIPGGMAEDSVSFLPYLMDATRAPQQRPPIVHDQWTLRDGDWKLILPRNKNKAKVYPDGELYNLKKDLAEQRNLVQEQPEVAGRLRERLASTLAQ